ncbi:retron Ec67 family RNA-directed DNA polymerase/endonuclease [Mesorhizobium sp. M0174]|uniref:retron Ec67 family RNA-directed DNA polymerase/endonuclease n=1 Tax=Mesorhizobium sp. M0174 TaxID=2956904 RepID=UPI003338B93B
MTIVSLKLEQYKKADTLTDVARILDLKPAHISYALYKLSDASKYDEFTVPKKSGGDRIIRAPHKTLKAVQKRLAKDLLLIEQELEASRVKKRNCILAHGFKKKLSIITNGENHRDQRYVFNADLKDFFPAINFGRVFGFFTKHKDFALKRKVAAVLTQIASFDNQLPQGSPCSPVISNLIASVMDIRLNELARQNHCTYTRYADDITFSTSEQLFPSAIGRRVNGSINLWEAGPKLVKTIARAGFELNHAKTRMQYYYSRQDVTGVVVNQKVNIASDYYATVAAMCHHLFMDGSCHVKVNGTKRPFSLAKLRGRLAFIHQVRGRGPKVRQVPDEKDEQTKAPPQKVWASFKLFERFLNYADLYGAERPVVLCEGVTDNIYIKSALHNLAGKYPALTSPAGELKIKLFKYTRSSAAVQQLGGGCGDLTKLARMYSARIKGFKSGGKHPVIMVVDSDEGSKDLFKHVQHVTKKKVDGSDSWYFLESNLYVIPIPKIGGADTPIEKLFEQALLDKPYEGKKFDIKLKETDGATHISKKTFASKVVAVNKATINFGGFEPVLNAVVEVIEDYKKRVGSVIPSAPTAGRTGAVSRLSVAGRKVAINSNLIAD